LSCAEAYVFPRRAPARPLRVGVSRFDRCQPARQGREERQADRRRLWPGGRVGVAHRTL